MAFRRYWASNKGRVGKVIRKLITKHRVSYLTGTYFNFKLEEFLAWFRVARVCQRQLTFLYSWVLASYTSLSYAWHIKNRQATSP